ncbi:selenium cofactor biosynthesis protein YqeC [Endozoicomonas sp. SCSIO W0465]|uniref:selenium cofactor biosynthesis protein YqeC n=1 Tax=Endozoicomonas sp. SCSIO W0465 TaxID=2918516 RepID=UPI002075F4E7|nr:selenium cofactor biosynthesis protein YqeC [Endozoicomonas sp. SCSIO W0465]USE37712.1 putative selenium-dependent hydroxylase accessory protein YqeC [Endozoicomonas sp. SCSIO W0465]
MLNFPGSLSWIDPVEDRIIAATGAGGKTSCLEYLALQLKQSGHSVLLTTTTRIFRPAPGGFGQYVDRLIEQNLLNQIQIKPKGASITLAGFPDKNPQKLRGLSPATIQRLISLDVYDNILIEADGSRQRPLKAPGKNEPVIPNGCQVIIGVTGWSGMGNTISPHNIHRWEEFTSITGLSDGENSTAMAIYQLLDHPQGLFKNSPGNARRVWLLNQVDNLSAQLHAREFIASVQRFAPSLHHYVISSFRQQPVPFIEELPGALNSSKNNALIC